MRNLRDVLVNDFGLGTQLIGWRLIRTTGVSSGGAGRMGDQAAAAFLVPLAADEGEAQLPLDADFSIHLAILEVALLEALPHLG